MKNLSILSLICLVTIVFSSVGGNAQSDFVFENPGKLFKKQDRRETPPLKTRYQFGVGDSSGREYLQQQDLFSQTGMIKSSGLFSEDGNKAFDVRYSYDENEKLNQSVFKHLKSDQKEVSYYNELGVKVKTEVLTKTDSLLYNIKFVYDDLGHLKEEQTYNGDVLKGKMVYDDEYNSAGRKIQICHYKIDEQGARKPQNAEMLIVEYDPEGLVLQKTLYNNKEKRKMLSWIYYKYQLDNDYKVIKKSGYDEEQIEVYRNELTYTDSSIISNISEMCSNCDVKELIKKEAKEYIFNSYGENTKVLIYDANGILTSTKTWLFDDFGNEIEFREILEGEPEKLIKRKQILEFRNEQAQTARKATK
ncbi:MAG: hypothetical protein WED33_03880 [Bacteroidia bacterium]